jgi:hypothetical protein
MVRKRDARQSRSARNGLNTDRRELLKLAGASMLGLAGAALVPGVATASPTKSTVVQIQRLALPDFMVEIRVIARV